VTATKSFGPTPTENVIKADATQVAARIETRTVNPKVCFDVDRPSHRRT
jgi:hypothetical protein